MDKQQTEIFIKLHSKFENIDFDESNVYQFFMCIREETNSAELKEMAHFFAHRQRDRGVTYNYFKHINGFFNENKTGTMTVKPIYEFAQIASKINNFLNGIHLNSLNDEVINHILLFAFINMQNIRMIDKDSKQELGELTLNFFPQRVVMFGHINLIYADKPITIEFPILEINDLYTSLAIDYHGYDTNGSNVQAHPDGGIIKLICAGQVL